MAGLGNKFHAKLNQVIAIFTSWVLEKWLLKKQLDKLYLIMGGHIFFQTLSAAVQLDLFTYLNRFPEGRTRSQISNDFKIDVQPARILLLGCVALGLLRKRGSTYSNGRLAERFFIRERVGNMVSIVEWQHYINYRPMHFFYQAIKKNTNAGLEIFDGREATLYERLAHSPHLERIFQDAMEAISIHANGLLAGYVDLSHVKHLVDVGGGNGTNIIALAQKYPALQATVFDSPSVCEIARDNIKTVGLSSRLHAVAGNCFIDEFPPHIDCILFAHFFTIWSEEKDRTLLKKCFRSLPSGGSVIVFNMMQSDEEDGPLSAAMGSPYFLTLATGEGMLYTWKEYQTWMQEAGFTTIRTHVLPKDHGAIIGIKD